MAKLSKKTRAMVSDDVRRIRARYAQALQAGYTKADAVAYANGNDKLVAKKVTVKPQVSESGPTKVRDTKPLGLEGKRPRPVDEEIVPVEAASEVVAQVVEEQKSPEPKKTTNVKIPKDWQDLAWPKLKALAESILGSEVKSRKHANEVIDSVTG